MSSKSKKLQLVAWILFLCLLIFPSFFIGPKALLRSLYPMLLVGAAINHRRIILLLFSPLVFFMPVAMHFWHVYHAPMNASFWMILLGTDVAEASDFLKQFWQLIIPATLILAGGLYWIWKNCSDPLYKNWKARAFTMLLLGVPLFAIGKNYSLENIRTEMTHHFSESYPWSFMMGYMVAHDELETYKKADFTTQWTLGAKSDPSLKDQKELIVLVIGESARRDRHQIYGYSQKTTPEMVKLYDKGDLLLFKDFITLHPHTMNAVPTLMTKQDNIHELKEIPPSFIQVYKDAGFKTYWLSNQAAVGGNENRVSVYARRSDYFHSLHISSINLPWAYDGELLPLFYEILKEPAPKKFVVLHLQGSHYGFDKRYPAEFNKFPETYDNTILYTDYLLGQVVDRLRRRPELTAMMYLADHGLMLGECGQYTHFDMRQSYEIPFWIWASPQWRSIYGKKYASAIKNASKKLSTLNTLDSLVDLGGLTYDQYEPDKSVLESGLKESFPRMVKTYSQVVDYDHGVNDKDCHLVNPDQAKLEEDK